MVIKVDKDLFLEIKSIHDYLDSKNKKDLNENKNEKLKSDKIILNENILKENLGNDNIYIRYLKDPEIILPKKDINNINLKCLFNEIDYDIEKGNNIIFPFINICENLLEAYIQSNLDDKEDIQRLSSLSWNDFQDTESFYQKVFIKLKNNCFISKEIMILIYEYFSELYHKLSEIKDDDDILIKKFDKMIKLFKIFYEKNDNKENENKSTICLLGANLEIIFDDSIILSHDCRINIKIKILNNYMSKIKNNEKLILIKINDILLNYQILNTNFEDLKEIYFNIYPDSICSESKGVRHFIYQMKTIIKEVKEIFILENFYGQLSSINVSIESNENEIEYEFVPISIRNNNCIYYYKKFVKKRERYNTPIIHINKINLVKINYINYNDDNFNIVDYFGGVIQFLPFYQIFKNLSELKTLNKIEESITNLADYIIEIIIKQLLSTKNSFKLFKKYILFVYYLLLDLNLDLSLNISDIIIDKYKTNTELYYYIYFLQTLYFSQKNFITSYIKAEVKEIIDNREFKEYTDLNNFELPEIGFKQLYKHYMKKLFIFNIFWSKKRIFFKNKINLDKKEQLKKVKYKQINYYTKNFQYPYIYPILDLREYYPRFSKYKGGTFSGYE